MRYDNAYKVYSICVFIFRRCFIFNDIVVSFYENNNPFTEFSSLTGTE